MTGYPIVISCLLGAGILGACGGRPPSQAPVRPLVLPVAGTVVVGSPRVEGFVRGPCKDAIVTKARVRLRRGAHVVAETWSDSTGFFWLSVPDGEFSLEAHAIGYNPLRQAVVADPGPQVTLALTMRYAVGFMEEDCLGRDSLGGISMGPQYCNRPPTACP
jgi:hypothetical protein